MTAPVPKVPELFVPVMKAMETLGGSASIEEINDRVAQMMGLPEATRAGLHGNGPTTKFDYRCAWTRSWLKNAGLTDNSERGVWSLTASGRLMLDAPADQLIKMVRKANSNRRKAAAQNGNAQAVNDEVDIDTTETAPKDWRERLLDILLGLEPEAFERLCQRILREAGFIKVEVTGRSGDGGIDGTGVLRVNLLSFHVLFQSKRWKGSVGASVVRDFRGAMVGRADKGLILTTGTFTADARREAVRDGAPTIDLIDGEALCDLLKEQKIGVKVRMVEEVTADEAAFAGF
ncbi:restriction system protein [Mesorhizobium albiziae]|uniref:Restriction system protein n=1 Tax=Neomesorhizobium albiziae TaxID=335020 RepID=A0A1I3WKR9_9HYPH|nr:restriction endonuclease [Mesorhizobium albiziae]GLS31640.1 restriction endonuclease [Mesorhizobium albiziae]SFK07061.1 restriction system protein [Mesorhizobium albiziae]